jgi:ferritin-like protein
MSELKLELEGSRLIIDLGVDRTEQGSLPERVQQILPLLATLVEADAAWSVQIDENIRTRARDRATAELYAQVALSEAIKHARRLYSVCVGNSTMVTYGIVELDDIIELQPDS